MGLLVIFLGVLSSLFGTAMDIQLSSQSTNGTATDATYILSRLTYDIERAQSISTPSTLGQTTTSLVLSIGGINYTYAVDSGGNLTYTNNLGTFNLNSYLSGISSMTFTRIGNSGGTEPTVRIDITVLSNIVQPKGKESQHFTTTVALHKNQ